jgi:hypothetical protein
MVQHILEQSETSRCSDSRCRRGESFRLLYKQPVWLNDKANTVPRRKGLKPYVSS